MWSLEHTQRSLAAHPNLTAVLNRWYHVYNTGPQNKAYLHISLSICLEDEACVTVRTIPVAPPEYLWQEDGLSTGSLSKVQGNQTDTSSWKVLQNFPCCPQIYSSSWLQRLFICLSIYPCKYVVTVVVPIYGRGSVSRPPNTKIHRCSSLLHKIVFVQNLHISNCRL
jgi:hypothetical protein